MPLAVLVDEKVPVRSSSDPLYEKELLDIGKVAPIYNVIVIEEQKAAEVVKGPNCKAMGVLRLVLVIVLPQSRGGGKPSN
ncbi:hypothetical protein ACFL6N_08000 [Thermodesulfobacteriota bacterium]